MSWYNFSIQCNICEKSELIQGTSWFVHSFLSIQPYGNVTSLNRLHQHSLISENSSYITNVNWGKMRCSSIYLFAPVLSHLAPVPSHFAHVLSCFAPLYHLVIPFYISFCLCCGPYTRSMLYSVSPQICPVSSRSCLVLPRNIVTVYPIYISFIYLPHSNNDYCPIEWYLVLDTGH